MLLKPVLKNKSKLLPTGPVRKTAYDTPLHPGNLKTKMEKRDPFCVRNFFLAAFLALPFR